MADLDGGPAPAAEALSKDGDLPLKVLGARICALATRMAQATFHWLVMIAEFDRREGWGGVGIRSCAHWLAWTCSMATGTAREHVRVARALQELPLVSAQMAEGRLSNAKVREITRVADRVDEATLVDLARTSTASQLARTVQGFRRSNRDRASQEQRRGARWWTDDDGSVVLSVRLPAEEGAAVIAALQAARDDLTRHSGTETDADADGDAGGNADSDADPAADLSCGSERSDARGRQAVDPADVVLQWARGYLSASPEDRSGEDRTMVVVHVAAEHLLPEPVADADVVGTAEHSRGNAPPDRTAVPTDCCQIPGVDGVSADTAARLACDAYIVGVIRGAGGVVLAHGRRRRSVSRAQRRLLTIRDGMCRYPSCTRVSHLEAHHVRHVRREALSFRTEVEDLRRRVVTAA